jgi:hypothetical protein
MNQNMKESYERMILDVQRESSKGNGSNSIKETDGVVVLLVIFAMLLYHP